MPRPLPSSPRLPTCRNPERPGQGHSVSVTVATASDTYVCRLRHFRGIQGQPLSSRRSQAHIVEVSNGFITMPPDDFIRLVEHVQKAGFKAKPEVRIQFGAGGGTAPEELEAEGTRDVTSLVRLATRCLELGVPLIMIESEGITESVRTWKTDVIGTIAAQLGLENVMFETADPDVFAWYVKNYGPEVNSS